MRFAPLALPIGVVISLVASTVDTTAQTPEAFYRGKQITMIIAGGVGGGYDLYARTFGRYLGRHIAGEPQIIPKNIPAAGGLAGANALFTNTEHDGLTIGALTSSSTLDPLFASPGARFDSLKLDWLGSIGKLQNVCVTWHTSAIKTVDDLRSREVLVGGSGATSDSGVMPKVLNALLGTRMKVITGYDAGAATEMAVERGEIEGVCGLGWSTFKAARPDWIRDRLINVILQMGMNKHKELLDVPMAQDFVVDPFKKRVLELILLRQELGRPFAAPPDTPADRLAALRSGFDATLQDPQFLADAAKALMEIDPLDANATTNLLKGAYASPRAVIEQAAALVVPADAK